MLQGLSFLCLSLFPAYAAAQLTYSNAKCSPGFEWLFNSANQSPCDLATSLGGVCVASQLNITQLDPGNVYFGPTTTTANSCRCSSVYYSLLSACAFCQQHSYIPWSMYKTNCTNVTVGSFPQPIPLGVKVPTWAYQDVSTKDLFDINIANSTDKSEGPPSSGSSIVTPSSSSGTLKHGVADKKVGVIAGAVGALIGLAMIGGLVAFCLIWKKRRSTKSIKMQDTGYTNFTEVTRPTIPGFSAPGTPGVSSGVLQPNPVYPQPNAAHFPAGGNPFYTGGNSNIYNSNPALLPNTSGENFQSSQNPSFNTMAGTANAYYDPQSSLPVAPVTTDHYWAQTTSPSMTHSQITTDRYHESPALSLLPLQQTGDSGRVSDLRSVTSHHPSRQSSMISSPRTNHPDSIVHLMPPSYADVTNGSPSVQPQNEKQRPLVLHEH